MDNIIICGDFCPTRDNEILLSENQVADIVGEELASLLFSSSFNIVNVETSFVTIETPKKKRGQINSSNPASAVFLKRANFSLCCLSNNHSIDNGEVGANNTLNVLETLGLKHIGMGKSKEEAAKSFKTVISGKKISVLNIADNEFNSFEKNAIGCNVFDSFETFDLVAQEKSKCDYLIVIYHGGIEYYQYPSPRLQKICRKFVDCGADLVTCQHSHCIGSFENYSNSTIVYGQGNFLFNDSDKELEKSAILLNIFPSTKTVDFVPVVKHGNLVRMANSLESQTIMDDFLKRSKEITKEGNVKVLFKKWATDRKNDVFNTFVGYYKPIKALNKLSCGRLYKKIFSSKSKMRLFNILKSEALKEFAEEVVDDYE